MSASKVKFAPIDEAGRNDIPTDRAPNAISMGAAQNGADRDPRDLNVTPLRASGVVDEQFPTDQLTKTSPKDELMTTKLSLQGGPIIGAAPNAAGQAPQYASGVTPFGKLVADDQDFKWLQSKRDQEAEANFQQWFATNFDFMSPEQKAAARELFPSFYEQRLKLLDKDLETLRELARIKITGITNRRDLLLTYAAEGGFLDVDRITNVLNPELAQQAQQRAVRQLRFARGLLNPRRLARGAQPPIVNDLTVQTANDGTATRAFQSDAFAPRNYYKGASTLGIGQSGFNLSNVNYKGEASSNANAAILRNIV